MYTNTSMTIYNKHFDKSERMDLYHKTEIDKVFWDDTKAYNRLQSGMNEADEVTIFVPFDYTSNKEYISPKEYAKLDDVGGYFTFRTGDVIVKGKVDTEVDNPTELEKHYEVFVITSVDTKDYGSPHMRHWQIGGE